MSSTSPKKERTPEEQTLIAQASAIWAEIPDDLQRVMLNQGLKKRRKAGSRERRETRERLISDREEQLGRELTRDERRHLLLDGRTRKRAPQSDPEDRLYVPAALTHFRRVHGLTCAEASERVGYAENGRSWQLWESGRVAPPYGTLLRIIAATGLGHWHDESHAALGPDIRLDAMRAQERQRGRLRRARRPRARSTATRAT
jgi:hypothetical protein